MFNVRSQIYIMYRNDSASEVVTVVHIPVKMHVREKISAINVDIYLPIFTSLGFFLDSSQKRSYFPHFITQTLEQLTRVRPI